ncbi:MAG: hypothetical protein AAF216_06945 [Pseudomonadota bacterium]
MARSALATSLMCLPLLSACIVIDADGDGADFTASVDRGGAGTVYGAEIAGEAITYRVTSNGCTDEGNFHVDVNRHDDHFHIELDRIRDDNCRAYLRDGTTVSWTYEELGLPEDAKIVIANPVRRR